MAEQQEPIRRMTALKVLKPGMDSRQIIARIEAERQALGLGRLGERETSVVAQLDQVCSRSVNALEPLKTIIDCKQINGRLWSADL
jgi:hypothetical protein